MIHCEPIRHPDTFVIKAVRRYQKSYSPCLVLIVKGVEEEKPGTVTSLAQTDSCQHRVSADATGRQDDSRASRARVRGG
jgi:hypothetical protein